MASKQGKVLETQILEPKVEWYEDTENHVLRVRLPGMMMPPKSTLLRSLYLNSDFEKLLVNFFFR